MKKTRQNHYARVSDQAMRMRKLYSQMGEPLPADVIIDLCRHLDRALELADSDSNTSRPYTKKSCMPLN